MFDVQRIRSMPPVDPKATIVPPSSHSQPVTHNISCSTLQIFIFFFLRFLSPRQSGLPGEKADTVDLRVS